MNTIFAPDMSYDRRTHGGRAYVNSRAVLSVSYQSLSLNETILMTRGQTNWDKQIDRDSVTDTHIHNTHSERQTNRQRDREEWMTLLTEYGDIVCHADRIDNNIKRRPSDVVTSIEDTYATRTSPVHCVLDLIESTGLGVVVASVWVTVTRSPATVGGLRQWLDHSRHAVTITVLHTHICTHTRRQTDTQTQWAWDRDQLTSLHSVN